MDDLLSEFIAETQESINALSTVVVTLEADPSDRALLDQLCRFFHTVKGSCSFLNLPRFERLSHAAEDVLSAFRSDDIVPNDATISAILAIMDRIAQLCDTVGAGESLQDRDDEELIAILRLCQQSGEGADIRNADMSGAVPVGAMAALAGVSGDVDALDKDCSGDSDDDDGQVARVVPMPRTVRLPLSLIDQLMNGVSDVLLARNELARKMRDGAVDPESMAAFDRLSMCIGEMRDTVSKTRMQRVERLFQAVPRMVRDLGRELGKTITLSIEGGDVEMDREMIEMVIDPLTHIVRNSISHGIECPVERIAAGKGPAGQLGLRAYQSGSQIVIEVTDDGRGIDVDAVTDRIIASGRMSAEDVARLDHQEKLELIFTPGLSTASEVTAVSGRGVGMDVVRANIEHLGGTILLQSEQGRGLNITMRVPMTLTIIPGLTLYAGELNFALARSAVIEILHETNPMVSVCEHGGRLTAIIRNTRYSMVHLEQVLGRPVVHRGGPRTLMLVRSSTGIPYVLSVSQVENHEELVIRPAAPMVMASGIYAGMTLPDSGQPMLLLDAAGIADVAGVKLVTETVADNHNDNDDEEIATYAALRFLELTGEERVIRLSLVDKVEKIAVDAFVGSNASDGGSRGFVMIGQDKVRRVPSVDLGMLAGRTGEVTCLRIRDGVTDLCYPVASVLDIHDVPQQLDVVMPNGLVAGLIHWEGRPVEVIDAFALMALQPDDGEGQDKPPRCVIADKDDIWNREILAPLLMQAGYQVAWGDSGLTDAASDPDIVLIAPADENEMTGEASHGDRNIVRLRSNLSPDTPQDGSVYRYDRDAVLGALASAALSGRGAA